MKYTKHFTWNQWKKFNKPVQPDNTFSFINHSTGKVESYESLTMQEVLLSKYVIILDEYEPKWIRRYHSFTKVVNQKNLDKSLTSFNGMVNAFSGGLGSNTKQNKKNQDALWGSKKSKDTINLWGKKSNVSIWGDKPKKTRRKSKKSKSQNIWNDDKTSIW